jgi:hypothetical protein
MKSLQSYSPQALQDLSSQDQDAHRKLYKQAIRTAADEVTLPEDVLQLLAELEDEYRLKFKGFPPKFRFGRQRNLSFIESYLVARFGEDPRVWPFEELREAGEITRDDAVLDTEAFWAAEKQRLSKWVSVPPKDWALEIPEDE